MRNILIFLIMVLMMVAGVSAAFDYSTDAMNYWKFDGDITDSTGHENMTNPFGNISFIPGKLDQGVENNAANLEVQSGNYNISGLKTIDFWFYVNTSYNDPQFFIESDQQDTLLLYAYPSLPWNGNTWVQEHAIYTQSGAVTCTIIGNITVVNDTWNHHVFVFNGSRAIGYINGVVYSNDSCAAVYTDDTTYFAIEKVYDNMLIANYSYDQSDVDNSYNSGAGREFDVLPTACNDADTSTVCNCTSDLSVSENGYCFLNQNLTLGGGTYNINFTIYVNATGDGTKVELDGNGSTVNMVTNTEFMYHNGVGIAANDDNNVYVKDLTFRSNATFSPTFSFIYQGGDNLYLDDVDFQANTGANGHLLEVAVDNTYINNSRLYCTGACYVFENTGDWIYIENSNVSGGRSQTLAVDNFDIKNSKLDRIGSVGLDVFISNSGQGRIDNVDFSGDSIELKSLAQLVNINRATNISTYEFQDSNNRVTTITNSSISLVLSLTELDDHTFKNNTIGSVRPRGTMDLLKWYMTPGQTTTDFDFDDASFGSSPRAVRFFSPSGDVQVDFDISGILIREVNINDSFQMSEDYVWGSGSGLFAGNATVTFYNVNNASFRPIKNGAECTDTCINVVNDGENLTFDVIGWDNYTVADPTNFPPDVNQTPSTLTQSLNKTETVNLSFTASDPENLSMTYNWFLEGTPIGAENDTYYVFTAVTTGNYYVNFTIDDTENLVNYYWFITVDNIAPNITSTDPSLNQSETYRTSVTFTVTVDDLDNDTLYYEWDVNNATQSGETSSSFTFTPGVFYEDQLVEVTVYVTDGIEIVSYTWYLEVTGTYINLYEPGDASKVAIDLFMKVMLVLLGIILLIAMVFLYKWGKKEFFG